MSNKFKLLYPINPNPKKIFPNIRAIIKNNIYSNFGPMHQKFLKELSNVLKIPDENIILTSSGYSAIEASMSYMHYFHKKKSCSIPAWSFPASINVAKKFHKKVFIDDVNQDGDLNLLRNNSINIIQSPFGYLPKRFLNKNYINSCKILDFAASLPNIIHKKIKLDLDENELLTISLHATKLISSGEGGLIISKDKHIAKELKKIINFGLNSNRELIYDNGVNAKLSEYNCAIGLESLHSFMNFKNKYYDIKNKYRERLLKKGIKFFQKEPIISLTENIVIKNYKKADLITNKLGRRWWICLDQNKKNSYKLWKQIIGLPFNAKKNISKNFENSL